MASGRFSERRADLVERLTPTSPNGRKALRYTFIVAIVLLALALPNAGFANDPNSFFPIFTIVICAVYALFALGLNIVVGFAGLLDLGYVAFFLFGAYTAAWMMSGFGYQVNPRDPSPKQFALDVHFYSAAADTLKGVHISFWIVVVVAAAVAALAGLIIGAPTLRLKSDYLALVTLGFGEILPEVFRNANDIAGYNLTNGTKGIGPVDFVKLGVLSRLPSLPIIGKFPESINSSDYKTKYYVILLFCALFAFASLKLRDGKLGRAWMAIREDELAASLMGVPLMRTKLWSYAVGAVAGGVGGAFYATIVGTVNVDTFTFQFSIIILCAVILGGMGNVWGAIAGGIIITWFSYTGLIWIGDKVNSAFGTDVNLVEWEFALFGLTLVLMMLFRPQGLIPAARTRQVTKADRQVLEHEHMGYGLAAGPAEENIPTPRGPDAYDPFEVGGP